MEVLLKEGVNVYGHYTFTSNKGNVLGHLNRHAF